MINLTDVKQLWASKRWTTILESTATGLQLNLTLIIQCDNDFSLSPCYPLRCPVCQSPMNDINLPDTIVYIKSPKDVLELNTGSEKLIILPLRGDPYSSKLFIAAREYACCQNAPHLSLRERAIVAQKILSSFQYALHEGLDDSKRALYLNALRQINYMLLSLLDGKENILTRVFDLILSVLIILSDACGSWIEYGSIESTGSLLIKGNEPAVKNYISGNAGYADTTEISNGRNRVLLGVCAPKDAKQSKDLLNLMAQECILVLEIERLYQLLSKQLPMILGNIGSAAILVDKQGNITYANQTAELFLGEKIINLIGSPLVDVPGPWSGYVLQQTNCRVGGHMDNFNWKQEPRWVDWQVCPMLDEEETIGWLILVDDRTDHHNWVEAARRAERLATTTVLAGSLAHELRNPLGAAKGLLQLIKRKENPEQIKGFTDLIQNEIDRVTNLLNEFLLLGRPVEIATEPLDLAAFLQEITPLLENEALSYESDIVLNTENVPLIMADPGQLTQMILNIVRNALEAAGRHGHVGIRLYQAKAGIVLTVKDNGPGLAAGISDKVFTPFFTTKERGTGLGLAVAQAIVHNHGGNITLENASGGGTVCTVTLPSRALSHEKIAAIDVIISMADDQLRYPSEQALRTAGFSVISTAGLDGVLLLKDRFCPAIVLTDNIMTEPQNRIQISRTWPQTKLIAALSGNMEMQATDNLQIIKTPLDYVRLISLVRQNLKEDTSKKPREQA